ncbi:uncharacterized protein LOC134207006 [Armigeres subalbatus]|uniref:uncharacterized protein LOC134207006 n=1 Tax=Armigeres subalbatus TaxID=124917 RepID=UPI002ED29E1D
MHRSATSDDVFSFTGIFFQRFYKSQLRPKEWTRMVVHGDTATEIIDCMWDIALAKIERQVLFDDETPRWSENAHPTVNDANDFITLQDTTKKKFYSIDAITARILRGWKDKPVRIYVYVWSTNVQTNAQHQAILRKLLSPQHADRAGAHSVRDDAALADELKSKHIHLEGHYSSWLLWANFIHSSPAHKQDEMKHSSTLPMQLSKYFRWVPTSEPSRLEAVHKGLIVAQHNNSGWLREMGNVKRTLIECRKALDGAISMVENLEHRGLVGTELFTSMEQAVRPDEMELSQHLAGSVADCEDLDHQ